MDLDCLPAQYKDLMEPPRGFKINIRQLVPKIRLYELPTLFLLAFMLFVGAWRCCYYPNYTKRWPIGPKPITEYALKRTYPDQLHFRH